MIKEIKSFLKSHETLRRALRTFVQVAVGIIVSAVSERYGLVSGDDWKAIMTLAISSGLATAMNIQKEDK